jgi:hypothetical protein
MPWAVGASVTAPVIWVIANTNTRSKNSSMLDTRLSPASATSAMAGSVPRRGRDQRAAAPTGAAGVNSTGMRS